MKKVFYLLTVSFLFIYGCENEGIDSENSSIDLQETQLSKVVFNGYSIDGKSQYTNEVKSISLEELQIKSNATLNSRSVNVSTNGNFISQSGAVTNFSVMQNSGGTHGEIYFTSGDFRIVMDGWCIITEGNRAVYSGNIISVENAPCAGAGCPFAVGYALYWSVEDNGEGANATTDRYYNNFLVAPSAAGPQCLPPSVYDYIFTQVFGCNTCGYVDVTGEDDQIQVK